MVLTGAFVATTALSLAGCGSTLRSFKTSSVEPLERVVGPHDPVPPGGGRYQVGKPYTVLGRTYVPKEDPRYDEVGVASWYGGEYHHGTRTANGEVYDRTTLSAAHPTLPLPSYARVTSLDTGRSVIVRVNDRGPYAAGRIMDISEKTAEVLDMRGRGVGRVRIQYVGKAGLGGSDQRVLMASLRGPGVLPRADDHTLLASADLPTGPRRSPTAPAATPPVMVASAEPIRPGNALARPASPATTATLPATTRAYAVASDATAFELAGVPRPVLHAPMPTAAPLPMPKPAASSAEVISAGLPRATGTPLSILPQPRPTASWDTSSLQKVASARTSYAAESRIAAAHALFDEFGEGQGLARLSN